jgi:hypothetical protein
MCAFRFSRREKKNTQDYGCALKGEKVESPWAGKIQGQFLRLGFFTVKTKFGLFSRPHSVIFFSLFQIYSRITFEKKIYYGNDLSQRTQTHKEVYLG